MNPIRRYTLHRWNSRHNPLTRAALIFILCALVTVALSAALELGDLRRISAADKAMIAELLLFVEGKATLSERAGKYEIVYSVSKTTYEVK